MNGADWMPETEGTEFRMRLLDILIPEFGKRNVQIEDDERIRVLYKGKIANILIVGSAASVTCCLRDLEDDAVMIPKDEIPDYIPFLAGMVFSPALYITADDEDYAPHFSFVLSENDLDHPESVCTIINNICAMAAVASDEWNEMMSQQYDDE